MSKVRLNRDVMLRIGGVAIVTAGCFHPSQAPPEAQPRPPAWHCAAVSAVKPSSLDDAPSIVERAVSGLGKRGEQDFMLQLEAKLPGFAGWYHNRSGDVIVLMKHPGVPPDSVVRATVYAMYASRRDPVVRSIMAPSANAIIKPAEYSLSELVAIETRIVRSWSSVPGIMAVGTSLLRNRVLVGFKDSDTVCAGLGKIAALGVPVNAIFPEVWGEVGGD